MFHFRFKGIDQLTVYNERKASSSICTSPPCCCFTLREYGQIEIVMIVSNENITLTVLNDADRIVRHAFGADRSQELPIVGEDLDAVSAIVRDEYLLFIVAANTIGKFQVFRTRELIENVAVDIEDEDTHHFAFDHDDMAHAIDTNT